MRKRLLGPALLLTHDCNSSGSGMWERRCHSHVCAHSYHAPNGYGHCAVTHRYNCSDGYSTRAYRNVRIHEYPPVQRTFFSSPWTSRTTPASPDGPYLPNAATTPKWCSLSPQALWRPSQCTSTPASVATPWAVSPTASLALSVVQVHPPP